MASLTVTGVTGLPEVVPGDDLAGLIAARAKLRDGDVVVVAQKVVSKAEGALVRLAPGEDREAARARLVREQAVRIVAEAPWATIVETRHGLVCANAGIDASNVEEGVLLLLPDDPDASARRIRDGLLVCAGRSVAVVVSDTFGRPWRMGQTDIAIGLAGMPALRDERGGRDRFGRVLEVTEVAIADEVAAAADLVRRKADGVPVVVLRGLLDVAGSAGAHDAGDGRNRTGRARDLVRPAVMDLFPRGRGALADALARGAALSTTDERSVPPTDLDRALAAARRAGRGRVGADPGAEPGTVVLVTDGEDGGAAVAVGLAGGALIAALADLGWAAVPRAPEPVRGAAHLLGQELPPTPVRGHVLVVDVGPPAPERPVDQGR